MASLKTFRHTGVYNNYRFEAMVYRSYPGFIVKGERKDFNLNSGKLVNHIYCTGTEIIDLLNINFDEETKLMLFIKYGAPFLPQNSSEKSCD